MESPEDIHLDLQSTFTLLSSFNEIEHYTIASEYPTINSINCSLIKGDRCFLFESADLISNAEDPPVNYQSEGYGFMKGFSLRSNKKTLEIDQGLSSLKLNLSPKGKIKHLSSRITSFACFHRALFPLADNDEQFLSYIDTESYTINGRFHAKGFIKLEELPVPCNIYRCNMNKRVHFIIDSLHPVQMENFLQLIKAITYNFALISGNLIRNERYILQSNDSSFSMIDGFKYDSLLDSISGFKIYDSLLFKRYHGLEKRIFISKAVYQSLVSNSLSDPIHLRAINLLVESARYPPHIRASTYSVALETIKNQIIGNNSTGLKPIKNSRDSKTMRSALKRVVDSYQDDSMFNNKQILYNKIDNINEVPNTSSFILCFEISGITLTADDIESIRYRNEFLHGRLSFDADIPEDEYQMNHVVFKLHLLVSALILKRAGFNGHLLNYFTYLNFVHFKRETSELLFRSFP
jgi:hypothetical protein